MNQQQRHSRQEKSDELHAIGLAIAGEEYGLLLSSVQEVITMPRITRVPKAPAYVTGVINLHGNIVPVVDVAIRLSIGQTAIGNSSRVVVVEVNGEAIGLLAESVSKVTRLNELDIQPPPASVASISAEYLDGIARLADRFLIFLDLQRTFVDIPGEAHSNATH